MTPYDEHLRLARAMIHGHLYVENVPAYMEHVTVNGHNYILHPPLSAILSIPFVMCGVDNPAIVSALLGLVAVVLVALLTESIWLAAFFAFGTTFAYEATLGASWNFCTVASVPFTLLAIFEVTRNERFDPHYDFRDVRVDYVRPWLVGLWAALAALARYDLVLAFPVYVYCLWRGRGKYGDWRSTCLPVLYGAVAWGAVYIWFNEARFGTLNDISIPLWYAQYDRFVPPAGRHGMFSLQYVPFSLYTLFFMPPMYFRGFPWFRAQSMGQALLSLSPAFLMVQWSPWLMAALLCALPPLTVYASGFSQLGCRYYVQIFPFLIAAMNGKKLTTSGKALVTASILSSSYFGIVARFWGLA